MLVLVDQLLQMRNLGTVFLQGNFHPAAIMFMCLDIPAGLIPYYRGFAQMLFDFKHFTNWRQLVHAQKACNRHIVARAAFAEPGQVFGNRALQPRAAIGQVDGSQRLAEAVSPIHIRISPVHAVAA